MAHRAHAGQTESDTSRHTVKLILESTTESANTAALSIIQLAKSLRYNQEQCHDIELAVREVVANAILHGNRGLGSKRVFVTAAGESSGLVIHVRDEGQGFDPSAVPDPLQAEGLVQESGRGLFLVNASMDEVIWHRAPDGGMEVTLIKYPAKRRPTPPRNCEKRDPAAT